MTPLGWPATIHIEHPEQYYRQYLGVIQKGKKVLYINAIRVWETEETPPRNWRTHFYWVVDGGLGYWQVIYDPATQQFSGLQINPRA